MRALAGLLTAISVGTVLSAVRVQSALDARRVLAEEVEVVAPSVDPTSGGVAQEPAVSQLSETMRLGPESLRIAAAARSALARRPKGFRNDCSGYVSAALTAADLFDASGLSRDARVADYWAWLEGEGAIHHNPIPVIGDLAFFDNTHDRDGNGRMDDKRTHIAIVVDVEPDGTVVLAHKGTNYALIRMNLLHPTEKESPDGTPWNSFLRRTGDRGNPLGMYRTAALWSGFGTLP